MFGRRVNTGLLNALEAPLIARLVPRVPGFVEPDHLSLIALIGAGVAGVSLSACRLSGWFLIPAVLGLIVHWFGDSFDGALARHRKRERPRVGFLIDRCGDVSSFCLVILGLGLSPFLDLRLALMLLVAYLVNCIYALMKLVVDGVHLIGPGGVGATEGRAIVALWAVFFEAIHANPSDFKIGGVAPFDVGCGAALAIVLVMFVLRVSRDIERQKYVEVVWSGPARPKDVKLVALPRDKRKAARARTFETASSAASEPETKRT